MPESPPVQQAEIQVDVACPECGYNLRGLRGPVVSCPECGRRSDVNELLTRRWDKPWYLAPGFLRLSVPAAWAAASVVGLGAARFYTYIMSPIPRGGGVVVAGLLAAVSVWGLLLWWAGRPFRTSVGFLLALLLHAVLGSYLLGLLLISAGLLHLAGAGTDPLTTLALLGTGAGLLVLGHLGERFVARQCIRRYLNQPPRG